MRKHSRFLGLDVHAEDIYVAVAEDGRNGEVRSLGKVPNTPHAVRQLVKKLDAKGLRACYEAGPCGYELYWQLVGLGVECTVIAPSLIPVKSGDRVKTDRRDAEKLARCHRAGELTAVAVPSRELEALRDLVRARAATKRDQLRARNRLGKFLLRQGRRPPTKMTKWTHAYMDWVRTQTFEYGAHEVTFAHYLNEVNRTTQSVKDLEHYIDAAVEVAPKELREVVAGLQALRGIAKVGAVTLATEVGRFTRFAKASQLMSFVGVVPSEYTSSGDPNRRGITKTGNAHIRHVLIEAAWHYQFRPHVYRRLKQRQEALNEETKAIAWKAQTRLNRRYSQLTARGKPVPKAVVAVARELLGFVWAIGVAIEQASSSSTVNRRAAA